MNDSVTEKSESTLTPNITPFVHRKITRRRFMKRIGTPWIFLFPILLVHLLVIGIPAVSSIYFSFTEWSGISEPVFVGLDNYKKLIFDDIQVRTGFRNNLIWLVIFVTVPFALALFASSLLAQVKKGNLAYRTVLFIPYILPSVVTASIWRHLLNPRVGFPALLQEIGVVEKSFALLGRSSTALFSIAFIDTWHFWGFLMVLFLTAMQSIEPVLYDAAKIDGANAWQEFRHVTLPGIRPVVLFMFMMVAIWSFLVFDYIWILTQGGPAGSSDVMATVLYRNAFGRFEAGYAAAQGLTLSFVAGLIVVVFVFLRRRGWEI